MLSAGNFFFKKNCMANYKIIIQHKRLELGTINLHINAGDTHGH